MKLVASSVPNVDKLIVLRPPVMREVLVFRGSADRSGQNTARLHAIDAEYFAGPLTDWAFR